MDEGGLPSGVKDRSDEPGGGPAGVVDGFDAKLFAKGLLLRLVSGVEGGLEEKGTWNVDIVGRCKVKYGEDRSIQSRPWQEH